MDDRKNLILSFLLLAGMLFTTVTEASTCEPWVAMAISVQGTAEQRVVENKQDTWQSIHIGSTFCAKDVLRVRENSRIALILSNNTVVRLDENTTITFSNISPDMASSLDLKAGIAHFISRVKQAFKVITPFVNASIEGTEFVVSVEPEQAQVTVFEGVVKAENDKGQVILRQGQTAVALKDQAPVLKTLVKPRDAVQWALYYPTIMEGAAIDSGLSDNTRARLEQSQALNAKGDVTAALNVVDDLPDTLPLASIYTYRAALRLAVGRVDRANHDIERALTLASNDSSALALKSIIAVVLNRIEDAETMAQQAIVSDASNASAYLALSYARQASFDLSGALAALQKAPATALVHSRLAELYLMQGDLDKALDYANSAVGLNPEISHTQTVLGYAHLIQINIEAAKTAFDKAIHLDQANPLAHLGLGLAIIRQGELAKGRREIEYAASLDPNNALIRSYLGKAYYEEKRNKVAADQFEMAKALDPKDPTPWLYDAIRKQSENNPIGALQDLQKSISLNDNRAVYRSRFLLDQDNAAKSANLGQIYNDLGFEQMAIQEASKSLADDPGNYSAHRFLADMYLTLPRHEIATVSELLQAQLMQPVNTKPARPQLAHGNLGTTTEVGSAYIGYNEYTSLFERNQNNINLAMLAGGNDTKYYDAAYFGVLDNISFSAAIYDYKSDGYRENNDQDQTVKNALIQYSATPDLTLHFDINERDSNNGDIIQRFGENNFDPNLREDFNVLTKRIGFNYAINSNNHILFSHLQSERDFQQTTNDGFFFDDFTSGSDGTSSELQYILRNKNYNIISGIGYSDQDARSTLVTDFGIGPTVLFDDKFNIRHKNAYIYLPVKLSKLHTFIFAISHDSVENVSEDKTKTSPKFGYIYNGDNNLTLRLAAFKTLKRPILSDQTLEPTQIAGFNQFFDEVDGAEAERYGIGLDKRLSKDLFIGIEFTKRNLSIDLLGTNNRHHIEEEFHRAYLSWLVTLNISISTEFLYEDFNSEFDLGFGDSKEPAFYTTKSLPVTVKFFNNKDSFTAVTTTYIEQDISFENSTTMELDKFEESFTITDFVLGKKFYYHSGLKHWQLILGIKNIFDRDFNYHNTNTFTALPRPLEYYPERYSYGKIQFEF